MKKEPELKPCPFCGGTPEFVTDTYVNPPLTYLICKQPKCKVSVYTEFFRTKTGAAHAWNRRKE